MAAGIYDKNRHYFYLVTGFGGLIVFFWCLDIYRRTFISGGLIALLLLAITMFSWAIHYKSFLTTYGLKWRFGLVASVVWSLISWGLLGLSILLFTNYYLAKDTVVRKEFEILDRSSHPGNKGELDQRRPGFTINYKGIDKELVFAHRFYKWKDDYKSVILTLQEGRWGYEVIKSKAVTK